MELKGFEKFSQAFDDAQDVERQKRFEAADELLPVQERILRLEQTKAKEESAKRAAALEQYSDSPLVSLKDRINLDEDNAESKVTSGFKLLDKIVRGFRAGNSYVLGGLEKSGKSSFLLNIFNHLIKNGTKTGYLNTELTDSEWVTSAAAVFTGKPKAEIEDTRIHRKLWLDQFDGKFEYAGIEDGVLDFTKAKEIMEKFALSGCKVIMLDNLTTYQTVAGDSKSAWEVLASCISQVVAFAKRLKIVVFFVIHTKPSNVMNETSSGIKKMIQEDPRKILRESITITKRPSMADLYGGGRALSQVSGAILIWRPYQKYDSEEYKRISLVILDSFRHAPSGKDVEADFDGASGIFRETFADLPEPEVRAKKALRDDVDTKYLKKARLL